MTLTVRSASITGATTAARALTHAEMDENWNHVANFTQSGINPITEAVQEALRNGPPSVMSWIPLALRAAIRTGTSTTDVSTYINNAIADVGSGGALWFPNGRYYTTAFLNAEGLRGLTLTGPSGQYGFNGARIYGAHTGKTILSLVGSLYCRIDGITLEGDSASKPKTGVLLGRSSAASASNHTFIRVNVQGHYSVAGVYNVASEENTWISCYIVPTSAPYAGLYMSQADGQIATIGGLTSSSMEGNSFFGGAIGNSDTTAGSTGIYLDCGASTGHHHFYGVFLPKEGGDSHIYIKLGGIDGLDTEFPIGFHDCFGESTDGPTSGLHFVSATTRILSGFTAKNLRFQTPDTNNILCDGGGSVYLIGADISTPYKASGTKAATFNRVDASKLSLLAESAVTITTLTSSNLISNATPTITTNTNNTIQDQSGTVYSSPAYTKALKEARVQTTYGVSIAVDASLGNLFDINVADGVGFTVANPTNPATGQEITFTMRNNSGGAVGAVTWDTLYKLAAWVSPATGNSRSIIFRYNGSNWIEIARAAADVPN